MDFSFSDLNLTRLKRSAGFEVRGVFSDISATACREDVDIISGKSRFYNQSTAKTYEVQTRPLTSDEAEWMDQLFSSYDVFRIKPDATNDVDPLVLDPILITDCTCEVQNGDEKLNTVKFTWRYTDNRPIVRLSASRGIFTSSYNIVYL